MAKYKFDMGVKTLWIEEIMASDCSSGTMATAYALAWFSDRETGRIRVSHPILADWTHLNIKTVQRGIQALVDMKKIIRIKKGYSSNVYYLVLPDTDMQTDISGNATEPEIRPTRQPSRQPPRQPNLGPLSDSENEDESGFTFPKSVSNSETDPPREESTLSDYDSPLYEALIHGGPAFETFPDKFTREDAELIVAWRDDPDNELFYYQRNEGVFRKDAWREGSDLSKEPLIYSPPQENNGSQKRRQGVE